MEFHSIQRVKNFNVSVFKFREYVALRNLARLFSFPECFLGATRNIRKIQTEMCSGMESDQNLLKFRFDGKLKEKPFFSSLYWKVSRKKCWFLGLPF